MQLDLAILAGACRGLMDPTDEREQPSPEYPCGETLTIARAARRGQQV